MQPKNHSALHRIENEFRTLDPIETTDPRYDDTELAETAKRDIANIDTILATDGHLSAFERQELYEMGANLRLEWLYAEHGGKELPMPAFAAAAKDTEAFLRQASADAFERHDTQPQAFWSLQTKLLDLRAFTAHRYAEDSQTTLKGTPDGQRLFGFSQDIMKSVLADSIRLMKDMEAVSQGHSSLGQDARGSLYEVMLLTYARMQTYEEQSFDRVFARSALSREDRPWNKHEYPKRAFDIVIQRPSGVELLQAKNYANHDAYAAPIRKIQDTNYRATLEELPHYIHDFSLLLDNPADPLMEVPLIKAQRRLDEAFGAQLQLQT